MDSLITGFTTDYHTAALIPVFAYGPGAEFFSGIYENTAIHTKMRKLMQIEERLNDLQAQQ
jgi:alkaline phosphatase